MSYRLKLKESPSQSVQRILHEQIVRCAATIAADNDDKVGGIHEARRCLKRIRALLRLVRSGLDKETFATENARYRDIGRLLGGQRDRHVLLSTLSALEEEHGAAGDSYFALVRDIAQSHSTQAGSEGAELSAILAKARRMLKKADREADRLVFHTDDFTVVAAGVEKTLDRCHREFSRAQASMTTADWHDWRKSVQQHWRQMQLLHRAWPDYFEARAKLASNLSSVLGSIQDLAMLQRFLASSACATLSVHDRTLLDTLASDSIERRQERARPLGERLLAERPSGLRRRTDIYWRTGSVAKIAAAGERSSVRPSKAKT